MGSNGVMLLIIIICVILSGYFSATETAFSAINRVRIRNQAEKGHPIFSCVGNFPVPRARKTSCARIYFLHAKGWKKTGENHHILLTSIFIGVSIGLIAKWRTLSQNYC